LGGGGFYFNASGPTATCPIGNRTGKTGFTTTVINLCSQFNWTQPTDLLNISIFVDIPLNATTGAKLATIAINATAVTPT
jgi:hypothetical protein